MRFAKIIAVAALLPLLSAGMCKTAEPVIKTVEVKVAVPVACLDPAAVPKVPDGLGPLPTNQKTALDRALAKLLEWEPYGVEADGKMRACAK
jgi:hypothetical protein